MNVALTTFDNPYNPFEQFNSWFLFDVEKGYNSCAYLGRIAKTSEQFSDEENEKEIEKAIDEIVKEPEGGAQTDHAAAAGLVKKAVVKALEELMKKPVETLLEGRYEKIRSMGNFFPA
jgi:hypothetical protein